MDKLLASDWGNLITTLGVLVALIFNIVSMFRYGKNTSNDETKNITEMKTDIKYIKESMEKLEAKVDENNHLVNRIYNLEATQKNTDRRLKELEEFKKLIERNEI